MELNTIELLIVFIFTIIIHEIGHLNGMQFVLVMNILLLEHQ